MAVAISASMLLPYRSPQPLRLSDALISIHIPTKTLAVYRRPRISRMPSPPKAISVQELEGIPGAIVDLVRVSPPTWSSAIVSNLLIFTLGSPLLVSGLSVSGIGVAFLLGTLTWGAFGPSGFLLVATYFVLGTVATKVKIAQKEALGVAEKRRGRRGPGSVIGSSAAGCICAVLSISGVGGVASAGLWQLGFVASFCTKLSDTVSSEIGKAYGKTTYFSYSDICIFYLGSIICFDPYSCQWLYGRYLVTTFKVVPRGTEGAVSMEGTIAGLLASIFLSILGYSMGEVDTSQAAICVLASQVANLGESLIGAALQDKEGFRWLNNDIVNIINISIGSIVAILMQLLIERLPL